MAQAEVKVAQAEAKVAQAEAKVAQAEAKVAHPKPNAKVMITINMTDAGKDCTIFFFAILSNG